jgi:hypothetical protein
LMEWAALASLPRRRSSGLACISQPSASKNTPRLRVSARFVARLPYLRHCLLPVDGEANAVFCCRVTALHYLAPLWA